MCQRFCCCFDMLAFHICGVYFNFLNIYRQIRWPATGNISTVLMRANFRCQLPHRLLIRRLQRVLRLSHLSLRQHRISESILSVDNKTNGASGTKCNFVCNWKSTCAFWWSLFFLSQAFTGLTQRSFQPTTPWRTVLPLTETFTESSSGFSPSDYSHPPSPETGSQSRLGMKSPQGRNLVRQATRRGFCHLRLCVALGSWSKAPCETNVNPCQLEFTCAGEGLSYRLCSAPRGKDSYLGYIALRSQGKTGRLAVLLKIWEVSALLSCILSCDVQKGRVASGGSGCNASSSTDHSCHF